MKHVFSLSFSKDSHSTLWYVQLNRFNIYRHTIDLEFRLVTVSASRKITTFDMSINHSHSL